MNTDAPQERTPLAEIGYRLGEARKAMNLSQQVVAEQLRLKVTTVRELEAGLNPLDLAPTFIRGYIRSYAKLVQIPEQELLSLLPKTQVEKNNVVESNRIKGFTLGKPRKKLDRWLTLFTWLILFVVLGLTGAWWWENHKAQQDEMASSAGSNTQSNQILIPTTQPESSSTDNQLSAESSGQVNTAQGSDSPVQPPSTQYPPQNSNSETVAPTLEEAVAAQVAEAESAQGQLAPPPADNNDIYMTFTADCWVEVIDSRGKNLYSGLQRKGGKLSLTGQAPYRVKLGAPAGAEIVYKGKQVDMSQYKNSNRTARLTLAAE